MAFEADEAEGCLARRAFAKVGMDELDRVRTDLAVPGRLVWGLTGRGGGDISSLEALLEGILDRGAMLASVERVAYRPDDPLSLLLVRAE